MIILMLLATGMAMFSGNHQFSVEEMEVINRFQQMELERNQGIQQNQPEQDWYCPTCTFLNSKELNKCEMCNAVPKNNQAQNNLLIQDNIIQDYNIQQQPLVGVNKFYNYDQLKILQARVAEDFKHVPKNYAPYQIESKNPGLWYAQPEGQGKDLFLGGYQVNEGLDFNAKIHTTGDAMYKIQGTVYHCWIEADADGHCLSMENSNWRGVRQIPKYYSVLQNGSLTLLNQKIADAIEDVRSHMDFKSDTPIKAHFIDVKTMTHKKDKSWKQESRRQLVTQGFKSYNSNEETFYEIYQNGSVIFHEGQYKTFYMKQEAVKPNAQQSFPSNIKSNDNPFTYWKWVYNKHNDQYMKTDTELTVEMSERVFREVMKISHGKKKKALLMRYVPIPSNSLQFQEAKNRLSKLNGVPESLLDGTISLDKKYKIQINNAGDVMMTDVSDFIEEGSTRNWSLKKMEKINNNLQLGGHNENFEKACPICLENLADSDEVRSVCKTGHLICSKCVPPLWECPIGRCNDFTKYGKTFKGNQIKPCMTHRCLNKPVYLNKNTGNIDACPDCVTDALHGKQGDREKFFLS